MEKLSASVFALGPLLLDLCSHTFASAVVKVGRGKVGPGGESHLAVVAASVTTEGALFKLTCPVAVVVLE